MSTAAIQTQNLLVFSAEDVSLANEKYDRIVQIENEDISDLGISDFSNDEDENEESEVDDPDFDQ